MTNTFRVDGRSEFDFRPLEIQFPSTKGTVLISRGDNLVQVCAQLKKQAPSTQKPSSGFVQCFCINYPQYEMHMQQLISSTGLLQLESLCITTAREVYKLEVTAIILNQDGDSLDLVLMGAAAAAYHVGAQIRYIPSVLLFHNNCADCLDAEMINNTDEQQNSQLLVILDKSGSILQTQQLGEVQNDQLLEILVICPNFKEHGLQIEQLIREDLKQRDIVQKEAYKDNIH